MKYCQEIKVADPVRGGREQFIAYIPRDAMPLLFSDLSRTLSWDCEYSDFDGTVWADVAFDETVAETQKVVQRSSQTPLALQNLQDSENSLLKQQQLLKQQLFSSYEFI